MTNIERSIIIHGNEKNGLNRLNTVQKATDLKKNQKWEEMKCTVTVKTATDK